MAIDSNIAQLAAGTALAGVGAGMIAYAVVGVLLVVYKGMTRG